MAYSVQKKKKVAEDLELLDENGNLFKTIHVDLDADDMVGKINRKYTALARALASTREIQREAETNEALDGCYETLGTAVIDLFDAVFGDDDTQTIVDFYEGRYIEMCNDIAPFITNVIIPRITEIRNENKKMVAEKYKKKRKFFLQS